MRTHIGPLDLQVHDLIGYDAFSSRWNFDGTLVAVGMSSIDPLPVPPLFDKCRSPSTGANFCRGAVLVWDVLAASPAVTLAGVLAGPPKNVQWRSGVNLVVGTDLLRTVQLWDDTDFGVWRWELLPLLSWGDIVQTQPTYAGPRCDAVPSNGNELSPNRLMAFNPAGTIMAMFCYEGCVGGRQTGGRAGCGRGTSCGRRLAGRATCRACVPTPTARYCTAAAAGTKGGNVAPEWGRRSCAAA